MKITEDNNLWIDARLNQEEMEQANEYWRIYGKQIMSPPLIKAILCFVGVGVCMIVIYYLTKDEDFR